MQAQSIQQVSCAVCHTTDAVLYTCTQKLLRKTGLDDASDAEPSSEEATPPPGGTPAPGIRITCVYTLNFYHLLTTF
jgi:hypothetical protein